MVREYVSMKDDGRLKNIALILLSIISLPVTTAITLLALVSCYVYEPLVERRRTARQRDTNFTPRTVLVTGVGMTKGLSIARSFHEAGHKVIGADFEPGGALACGRFSRSISKFYSLQAPTPKLGSKPYIQSLMSIVEDENVDLWVSCSGVASAVEDGEAKEIIETRTSCKAVQFDTATTQILHEKHSFIEHTQKIGLTVPDTHHITDSGVLEEKLLAAPKGRKYIMKPTGMDDANRGDMTLLPKDSTKETLDHISKLRTSEKSSWILQQYIKGPEYCTHSLIVNGQVMVFVACPSAELLMHYEAIPSDSELHRAMLAFTKEYAEYEGKGFTGHLSFDFMVDESQMDGLHRIRDGEEAVLYPIECNPRAHTAVVLFSGTPGMPDAYLSLLDEKRANEGRDGVLTPQRTTKYYWIGHDFVELLLLPFLSIITFQNNVSITEWLIGLATFVNHILWWRDGTFERWDPIPWWWLYHAYWPMRFWRSLRQGKKWSRLNVSTTKVFEC